MRRALELAQACVEHEDVPVGAVVTGLDGAVIGVGWKQRELLSDPTAHAEVLALREAAAALNSWRLDGCTLYVTLEPCTMCAGAILNARVSRLVFGATEPRTGAVGSLYDVLREPRALHQVEVLPGVLADESAALLAAFFASRRL